MASRPEVGGEPLSLRHGIRCEVESSVAVREVLLSIGEHKLEMRTSLRPQE